MLDAVLYPGLLTANWQMLNSERMALMGLLAHIRPRNALEVGVYHGGSLSLLARHSGRVWACDIDAEVPHRFQVPRNVDLRIGAPESVLTDLLSELDAQNVSLDLILIDADHSADGVRRDIDRVLSRAVAPSGPQYIVMHDSGNPECRRGMASASWASNPYVHAVELDFVPGQIRGNEVWGGLGLAYLDARPRFGDLRVSVDAADTVDALHRATSQLATH